MDNFKKLSHLGNFMQEGIGVMLKNMLNQCGKYLQHKIG